MSEKFKRKFYAVVLFFAPLSLMAEDLKSGFGSILGYGATIAFVGCLYFFWDGVWNLRQGNSYSKDIIGIAVTAGSFVICKLIFAAFGLGDAVIDPTF
ncbi:MAG: hypothetical protein PHV59_01630 [Victivallales bacterium]|nr:hypothetical protein [Victivallales bacterium]